MLLFIVGVLLQFNIPYFSIPFYLGFASQDSLPFPAWAPVTFAALSLLFVYPLPIGSRKNPVARLLAMLSILAVLLKSVLPAIGFEAAAPDFVRSPEMRAIINILEDIRTPEPENNGPTRPLDHEALALTFRGWMDGQTRPSEKIGLFLIESWAENEAELQRIVRRLTATGITVESEGFTPYSGSTLHAEFRELCGLRLSLRGTVLPNIRGQECVPQQLAERGHSDMAFHGYRGDYYFRSTLWPRLGFRHSSFLETMRDKPTCRDAFAGICDSALVAEATDFLNRPGRRFVYVLTLGSHEPLTRPGSDRPCQMFKDIPAIIPAQTSARNTICHIARKLHDAAGSDMTFYIVGDHPPPSLIGDHRLRPGVVPHLVLRSSWPEMTDSVKPVPQPTRGMASQATHSK